MMHQNERKKAEERMYAEVAANKLGRKWRLQDCESPDFTVTEGEHSFGLELKKIFSGESGQHGSASRFKEGGVEKHLERARRSYETLGGVPVTVRLLGTYSVKDMNELVDELLRSDLCSRPVGYEVQLRMPKATAHVTRALRSVWVDVSMRAGWVERNTGKLIQDAIDGKAAFLKVYQRRTGDDVRLLLVADRTLNSGKVQPDLSGHFNLRGFRTVYFLAYPLGAFELLAATDHPKALSSI